MKQSDFIAMLKTAESVANYYDNDYPYNLGYHHANGYFSFDCWNMIKAILSGWNPNIPENEYIHPNQLVTGDVDGKTLLNRCTDRSRDFSKLSVPATYLYIYSSPHAGIYIGDTEINGHIVNVIECTGAWMGGVQYTYVDEKGGRYQYKGGSKNKFSWEEYGLLTPYVEYSANQPVKPAPTPITEITFITYTVKKGDTLSAIAKRYNTTVEKIVTANPQIKNPNTIYVGQVINIPIATMQSSTSATASEKVYHTVQRGETLSGIAKKYGTNYLKIATLNGIVNPNRIYVGQRLRVR